jgi:hypothetical protein
MNAVPDPQAEMFRVDYLRTPFIVMALAVASLMLYFSAVWQSPLSLAFLLATAVAPPLAISLFVGWYFGTVHVGPNGIVLYRTHRLAWQDLQAAEPARFLGLPYMRLRRSRGLPWLLPLYLRGPRPIQESLFAFAPRDCPARNQLALVSC